MPRGLLERTHGAGKLTRCVHVGVGEGLRVLCGRSRMPGFVGCYFVNNCVDLRRLAGCFVVARKA